MVSQIWIYEHFQHVVDGHGRVLVFFAQVQFIIVHEKLAWLGSFLLVLLIDLGDCIRL